MGLYRHGPVHKRKKRFKSKPDNLKKEQKRIADNRSVIRAAAAELRKDG